MIERAHLPIVARLLVPLLGLFFLVYPIRLELMGNPSPTRVFLTLGGTALFVSVFLWLMWQHDPLQLVQAEPGIVFKYRATIAFLAVLAGLLSFVLGAEWRMMFLYHINIAAGIMLPRRDAYASIAGIALLSLVLGFPLGLSWLAVPVVAIGLWSTSFVSQVAMNAELRAAREELVRFAVSEERLRFARDLHDLLGHSLSLIALKSELAERLLPDTADNALAVSELHELQDVARSALLEVREAVSGYRQPSLGEELVGARTMLEAAGITCRIQGKTGNLPDSTEAIMTWVVREGVTNVVRHSRATSCEIRLTQESGFVHTDIRDDGRGSHANHSGKGVGGSGLVGLAERLEASGGHLDAGPLPEGGFGLHASLTLGEAAAPEIHLAPLATDTNLKDQEVRS